MSLKEVLQEALKRKQQEEEAQKRAIPEDVADVGDKIIFTGLDNSGKSSIILALQNKYAHIALLQPTRQIERTVFTYLGKQITRWDLGGQQRYRIAYLKDPSKYFENTAACLFVLEIQDINRIDEAITYFQTILESFQTLAIAPPIYVFLHKADPGWMAIVDDIQESYLTPIKKKIKKMVGKAHKLVFRTTTIFTPWTIVAFFSEILLQLYPKGELVDLTIQEFASKIIADGIVVLDENALILGQYFITPEEEASFAAIAPAVLQLFDNFRSIAKSTQKMTFNVNLGEYLLYAVTDSLQSVERYVFIKAPLEGLNDADIEEFGNVLIDLLLKDRE